MVLPKGRGLVSKSVSWPFLFFMSSDYFSTGVYIYTYIMPAGPSVPPAPPCMTITTVIKPPANLDHDDYYRHPMLLCDDYFRHTILANDDYYRHKTRLGDDCYRPAKKLSWTWLGWVWLAWAEPG